MGEISRYGHRQRMRDLYLSGGMDNAPDHNLLELYLSLVIPQKDVKPLAYELMNKFGSLENIVNANPTDLMKVKGIGESSAVALTLIKDINKRIIINRNNNVTMIDSTRSAERYCQNILGEETIEKFLVVTLTNEGEVIHHHVIFTGGVSEVKFDLRKFTEYVLRDNAAGVLVAHNHPKGDASPSAADVLVTSKIANQLSLLKINFIDHIVVGKNECKSFRNIKDYKYLFNKFFIAER